MEAEKKTIVRRFNSQSISLINTCNKFISNNGNHCDAMKYKSSSTSVCIVYIFYSPACNKFYLPHI